MKHSLNRKAVNYVKLSGIVLSMSILFFSCGPSAEEKRKMENSAQAFSDSVSATTQTVSPFMGDTNRTFVRNANMSFKVKDVKTSTYEIEQIVFNNKGYITSSILESTINYKTTVQVSKDSLSDITHYKVCNTMVLRVPNNNLDKTLNELSKLIDYLDFRKITADDVTNQFYSAKLSENRLVNHKKRLENAIIVNQKKLPETVNAENDLLLKQKWTDEGKLNIAELTHDVAYSTVTIYMYQKETSITEKYASELNVEPYEPSYGSKLIKSLNKGAYVLGEVLLFFTALWPIFLIGISIIIAVKIALKRKWFM